MGGTTHKLRPSPYQLLETSGLSSVPSGFLLRIFPVRKRSCVPITANNSANNFSKPAQSNSGNNSQSSGSKSGKSKETPKTQSTKPDLTGKLDSKGKLTQQERQHRIDNNLCLFCGKPGHKVLECPTKPASSAKGRASTTASTPAQGKDSTTESKKQ